MRHKLTVFAVTVAATLGMASVGLAGTAAADGFYQVYGTGIYGLNVHTGPGVGAPNVGNDPEGVTVDVHCQVFGDSVTDPVTGVTSAVWDELGGAGSTPTYVSDLYLTTPGVPGDINLTPCQTAGQPLP